MTELVFRFSDGKVARIPIDDGKEITIGRDPASTLRLDSDLVSRRHALIRQNKPGTDQRSFTIVDLDSTNGTWVRGKLWSAPKRVMPEADLAVEDEIEFGKGGPRAGFDVDPREWHDLPRTGEFPVGDSLPKATKLSEAPGPGFDATHMAAPPAAATVASASDAGVVIPPKVGIGQATLERALSREREAAGRKWMLGGAIILLAIAAVAAALYFQGKEQQTALQSQVSTVAAETRQVGMQAKDLGAKTASLEERVDDKTAKQIAATDASAVVFLMSSWKLYDRGTGKQVWHKFITADGGWYPAYVELPTGEIVRWLITEDENMTNEPIGGFGQGSGFVVSEDGLILTNRHVAASWLMPYLPYYENDPGKYVALFQYGASADTKLGKSDTNKKINARLIPVDQLKRETLADGRSVIDDWKPGDRGYLFWNTRAKGLYGEEARYGGNRINQAAFETRDKHTVTFPEDPNPLYARFLRASSENDAALIKIDNPTGKDLKTVKLAPRDYEPKTGEEVTVMGYPAQDDSRVIVIGSRELLGGDLYSVAPVREPSLSAGKIGKLFKSDEKAQVLSSHYYQLTVNTSGPGNSGGPVFDGSGQVIGLYTYSLAAGRTSGAVPIEYGHKLMELSRMSQN